MLIGRFNRVVWISTLVTLFAQAEAAQEPIICGAEEAMEQLFHTHPQVLKEHMDFEKSLRSRSRKANSQHIQSEKSTVDEPTFVIPVVFHVYGTSFDGKTVDDSIIIDALRRTNEDFQGLTKDYEFVDSAFSKIKDFMSVEFRLAKIDPEGNPTTGIIYHDYQSGFADQRDYDEAIQAVAWDNYKYMNVYVQDDLSDDPEWSNLAGFATYPASYYSDNNLARVVYRGDVLGMNTNENSRSFSLMNLDTGFI